MKVRCFNGPYAGYELEIPEDTTEWTLTRPADSEGKPVDVVYEFAVDAKGTRWLLTPPEGLPKVTVQAALQMFDAEPASPPMEATE